MQVRLKINSMFVQNFAANTIPFVCSRYVNSGPAEMTDKYESTH